MSHGSEKSLSITLGTFLLVFSSFLFLLSHQIQTLNRTNSVTVDLGKIFWWAEAKVNIDQTKGFDTINRPVVQVYKNILIHHALKKNTKVDKILTRASSAVFQSTEAQQLLSIHIILKKQFRIALSTQVSPPAPQKEKTQNAVLSDQKIDREKPIAKIKPKAQVSLQKKNLPEIAFKQEDPKEKKVDEAAISDTLSIVASMSRMVKKVSIQNPVIVKVEYSSPPPQAKPPEPGKVTPAPEPAKIDTPQESNDSCISGEIEREQDLDTRVYGALDRGDNFFYAKSRVFSHEGSRCKDQSKWILTHSAEYWDTLSWWNFSQHALDQSDAKQGVRLFSQNTALMLAKLLKVDLQTSAGIVFGKVAPGYTVELSGRAESPYYLDREFVFLNVAPGAHLIYLRDEKGLGGVVAVPVLGGHATRVFLETQKEAPLVGHVYDARYQELRGLKEISVRVVGQNSKNTITDTEGGFRIKGVLRIADYPIFLETEGKRGYTHRHRILPVAGQIERLFRFSEKQMEYLFAQIEGGVSPESGVVVSSFPGLVEKYADTALYPQLYPLLDNQPILPETYTLSAEDTLFVHRPMEKNSPRFISIQVPEGPNLVKIETKEQKVIWDQIVISSPGVVQVLQ